MAMRFFIRRISRLSAIIFPLAPVWLKQAARVLIPCQKYPWISIDRSPCVKICPYTWMAKYKSVNKLILHDKTAGFQLLRAKIELTAQRQSSTLAQSWGSFD